MTGPGATLADYAKESWGGPGVLTVGLTGGIACGKSSVARLLAEKGCRTMDADRVVHDLLDPLGAAYGPVVTEFGVTILDADGRINRGKLADIVFTEPEERLALEAILHPLVIAAQKDRLAGWEAEGFTGIAVIEAALMIEAGAQRRFDRLVVVGALGDTQQMRLEAAGMDPEEAAARIAAQMPVAEKVRWADYVVPNDDTREDLERAVAELYARLTADLEAKRAGRLPLSVARSREEKPPKP